MKIEDVADNAEQTITNAELYDANQYMVVTLENSCVEGHRYRMNVSEFRGELGEDLDGLYRSEYINEFGKQK